MNANFTLFNMGLLVTENEKEENWHSRKCLFDHLQQLCISAAHDAAALLFPHTPKSAHSRSRHGSSARECRGGVQIAFFQGRGALRKY